MLNSKILKIATNTTFNAKINKVKSETPCITNFVTTAALTTVEHKISNVSDPVKKADYDEIISEM